MARLLGPDMGSRLVVLPAGTPASSKVGTVYSNAAGTILADILAYQPGTPGTPGAALAGSQVTTDSYGLLPLFWFPNGLDRLWITVNGGPLVPIDADYNARLDALQVGIPTGSAATDTANIQAALDAANAAGGGIVQLAVGTYLIQAPASASSGGLRINNNTTLAGYGIGVTILQVVAATTAAITGIVRTPSSVVNSRVTVRDLTIDGNQANHPATPAIIGFFCGVTPNSTQTDTDITLIRVEVMNCREYGFDPHERVTRLTMLGCVSHDNGTITGTHDGFTIDGIYDSRLVGCVSYNNGRHGFNLVTASTRVTITGCEAYGNGGSGIVLQNGAKECVITGNIVRSNTLDGILLNGLPQAGQQDNNPGTNNTVTANLVELSGGHGIHLVGASGNSVVGNAVRDSSQTTTATSIQIYLDESGTTYSTGNTVEGNDLGITVGVTNAPKYGIREKTLNNDNNLVLGNRSVGSVTAQISLLGTTSLALAAHNGVNEHLILASTPPLVSAGTGSAGGATTAARQDHAHPVNELVAAHHSLIAWNFPPYVASSSTILTTAGTLYLFRVPIAAATTITNVIMQLATVGAGLTAGQNFAALYSGAGALLSTTADQSTPWTAGGPKIMALTAPQAVSAGDVFVGVFANGTTLPTFSRGVASSLANIGSTAATSLFATCANGTALTTTMPATLGVLTAFSGAAYWAGVS